MSRALESALISACDRANHDPDVIALVLTGGTDRSFCAGGDFNEVGRMNGAEARDWIDRILQLYISCLTVSKPTVAAVDKHAVGIGFQLALCVDRAIGTNRAVFHMPELQHGIACTIGGYLLEKCLDRQRMTDLALEAKPLPAALALEWRVLTGVVEPENLLNEAVRLARKLAGFPQLPYRLTKASINLTMVEGLRNISNASKEAHQSGFEQGLGRQHFQEILGRSGRRAEDQPPAASTIPAG